MEKYSQSPALQLTKKHKNFMFFLLMCLLSLHVNAIDKPEWPPEALEKYDLDSLSLVRIVLNEKYAPYALIQDPDGYIHRLFPGGYIGKNHGLVKEINKNSIKIEEVIQDENAQWKPRIRWITKIIRN